MDPQSTGARLLCGALLLGAASIVRAEGPPGRAQARALPREVSRGGTRFVSVVRAETEDPPAEVGRQVLRTEELSKVPGTLGDPLRSIENLPGSARAPFNTGLFIIEGGRPTDSRVYLQAAEVPQLYHYGGFTSVVPGSFLSQIEYLPHGFSARYGRAIAGTIDVELRAGRRDRVHGALELNPIHAGIELEGPLGKGSFLIGLRRSYIDGGLALLQRIAGDVPGLRFVRAPVYWDYQAILDHPLGGGSLRVMALGSDDQLVLLFARPQDSDPTINGQFSTHIMFHRIQARYARQVGAWRLLVQSTTGYNGTDLALGKGINLSLRSISSDLRLEARAPIGERGRLLLGADVQGAYVLLDALVPTPLREGEFPRPPGLLDRTSASERGLIMNPALYAEVALWLDRRRTVQVVPGWRFDYFSYLGRWNLDPRLSVRVRLSRLTWLKASAGLYTQDPPVQDYFGTALGNPLLRLERAAHVSLALTQGIWRGLSVTLTGIYKHLWDLSAPSSAHRRTEEEPLGRPERVASHGGGRIYGGTLMLRQALSRHLFGWVSYSLLRSERRDCPSCALRLFDFDQTHVLVVVVHAYLPYRFEVGLRYRYVSGVPFTRVLGSSFDSDADLHQPAPAPERNTERLGPYNQLDLRVDRTFSFKRWSLKAYLDVSNIYNNPAPEQMVYSFDYARGAAITGLPIIPSLGVRGEF